MITSRSSRSWSKRIRQSVVATLTIILVMMPIPPVYAHSAVKGIVTTSLEVARELNQRTRAFLKYGRFASLMQSTQGGVQRREMPPRQLTPGVRPQVPRTKAEHEARVASLRINPGDNVTLQSRQPMLFSAIPLDNEGNAIHGLHAEWESSNRQIVFIRKSGEAVAGRAGTATVTATAGPAQSSVRVTVIRGTLEEFGGKKKQNTKRLHVQTGKNSSNNNVIGIAQKAGARRQHASGVRGNARLARAAAIALPSPCCDPNNDPLPDNETNSLYQPSNAVGSPPGKRKPGALTRAIATNGTESGNKNFSFAIPIVNLPGRGLDVSLALSHNSQVWNKSTDPSDNSTWMTYDVDSGWPEAGFRLSFGQIEDQGSYGFTLTDGSGTRHALTYTSTNNYDTTDGTFIHYTGGGGSGTLYYSDGTRVTYGAGGGGYRSAPCYSDRLF